MAKHPPSSSRNHRCRCSPNQYDDHDYGYLPISVNAKQLRIAYHRSNTRSLLQSRFDLVTVDLAVHTLLTNG